MDLYIRPDYEVVRNTDRCIACRVCERQCANEVHTFDPETGKMRADESKCVNCHRCVSLCPTHALKIVKTDDTYRENANWSAQTINEVYRQANTGGVLLSSMGNPKPFPVFWDKMLLNASQVTNPPIDPLREPMETQLWLGKRTAKIERDEKGNLKDTLAPQLKLSVPILFSAMSYGSISYNAHESLARAAEELGTYYNTGEGGLHRDFYRYGKNTIVQVASGRFGVHKEYLETAAAIEIKMGQGAKPGIGGHLPGAKISADVSETRMIPQGVDAISPAPHHDIYSIEDLKQLVDSLKEATEHKKPIIVKIAAVHNAAAIASGIARSGADIIAIDGFRGGTGAAPTRIRDNVGIPIEMALAQIDARLRDEGIPRRGLHPRGRLHPLERGRRQGDRAGRGRLLHRHGGAAGAGLPPLPHLPHRQVQLGHRDAAARPRQAAQPRPRLQAPRQPRIRMEARDRGDHGRHGHQLARGAARQPPDAARHRADGHRAAAAGHPLRGRVAVRREL